MNEKTTELMFSSKTNEWSTPPGFFHVLEDRFGPFTLDPCATAQNSKAPKFFTVDDDGLAQSWQGHSVFCNPPYGRKIGEWVQKGFEEGLKPATQVVMLIPARTCTSYWHEYVMRSDAIIFLRGRLKFGGSDNSAPFPSAVVIFGFVDRAGKEPTSPPGLMTIDARPINAQERKKGVEGQQGHTGQEKGQGEGTRGPHKPPPL